LREKASKRGQNFQVMAAELIQDGLSWEEEDLETSIAAIQAGLDDFEAGRLQSLSSMKSRSPLAFMQGQGEILGDLITPVNL
jgi:predicted transcriptional regulator